MGITNHISSHPSVLHIKGEVSFLIGHRLEQVRRTIHLKMEDKEDIDLFLSMINQGKEEQAILNFYFEDDIDSKIPMVIPADISSWEIIISE